VPIALMAGDVRVAVRGSTRVRDGDPVYGPCFLRDETPGFRRQRSSHAGSTWRHTCCVVGAVAGWTCSVNEAPCRAGGVHGVTVGIFFTPVQHCGCAPELQVVLFASLPRDPAWPSTVGLLAGRGETGISGRVFIRMDGNGS
jgi:hypothetical protein